MAKIAPSILAADFSKLGEEVKKLEEAGADMVHFDVMDGHFVPNITFGPMVVEAIRGFSKLPFDTHLMISEPQKYWQAYADAGSDIIGIHIETEVDHNAIIKEIQDYGKKACIVINPPTDIEKIYPVLENVEQVLIMSVNPGFGGQKFIAETLAKIENISEIRARKNLEFDIQIDGGINEETAKAAKQAGTDILVAGSFVFKSPDYRLPIEKLR